MSLYTTVLHDVMKKHVSCNLVLTPVNTTTPSLRPNYFGRMVVVFTGFHCIPIKIKNRGMVEFADWGLRTADCGCGLRLWLRMRTANYGCGLRILKFLTNSLISV